MFPKAARYSKQKRDDLFVAITYQTFYRADN